MRRDSIELYERTVTIGGDEWHDGNVHHVVMPRTIRIREYTDSQIEVRITLGFLAGFALGVLPTMLGWLFRLPLPI